MKNIFKYMSVLLVVLLLASCEEFLDVNTDPNNPSSVSADLVLPVAQTYTADIIHGRSFAASSMANQVASLMMYNWSQSDGFSWYGDEFKYNINSTFSDRIFEYTYYRTLKQFQTLVGLGEDYAYYEFLQLQWKAIAVIMKTYNFQLLVDFYGDIPYSEALQRGGNATPVYDDAQTVYEDLIVQLTAAIALIDGAAESTTVIEPGNDDVMFGGDMDDWKAFANTVKLRILTRQMSMAGRDAYIQAEFDAIVAEGSGFITDDVGVNPGYVEGEEDKQNPQWNNLGWDAGGTQTLSSKATCATDYILDYLMNQINDPRVDYLYETPATGHKGVPQGLLDYDTPIPDQYIPELVSNIGPGILKGGDMDAVIYTLAEAKLNLAEAALNGYITDDAQTLYEEGIQASFDFLGAGDASAYYGQAVANVGWAASAGNELEAIITQKWIAVNGITAEQSWFDYSRTGFPSGLPVSMQASTPDRPVRLSYTAGEISSNGANVN